MENRLEPCRKCGSPNPKTNQYCRSCGAVLEVSTTLVKAQRSWILPAAKGIRWKWVVFGAFATLGLAGVLLAGLYLIASLLLSDTAGLGVTDLASLRDELLGFVIVSAALFLLAFGLGGVATSLVARRRAVIESAIAAFFVLILFGAVGISVTSDAVVVAAVLALPCVALAGLGGWIGELFAGGRR